MTVLLINEISREIHRTHECIQAETTFDQLVNNQIIHKP